MEIREKEQVKQRVQRRIVLCSVMLMAGKFAAYFLTNSVGVLTDAMESIVNVTAGLISLYSLYRAARPADRNHPFGYGKIELISASIEGLLILLAGAAIVYEGIRRLFVPSQIEQLDTGIALVAGGRHLQSDTYSTIGLVAGLVLLYVTRIGWIDSALAMLFGGIIAWTGISILRKTASDLMDTADERYLEKMLETVSRRPRPDWIDIHNLKIIRYGSYTYIDCDLTLPWYYTVRQGHKACEELKRVIEQSFSDRVLFSVHSDPCEERHCNHCSVEECPYRREAFAGPLVYTLRELTENDEQRSE